MVENSQVVDTEEVISEQPVEQPAEKMLSQSQVNAIVQREKQNAANRARQQAEMEFQQRMEQEAQQAPMQQQVQEQQAQQQSSNRELDTEALYQDFQERLNREMHEREMQREIEQVAQTYLQKMNEGKNHYSDFEQVTADFDPKAFPQLVYLIAGTDNASDIVYELSKNPSKLVMLDNLALKSPQYAQAELNRLSQSIRDNRVAQNEAGGQQVNAPLDRMQPSRVSGSGGKMSINDLRSQPWLMG